MTPVIKVFLFLFPYVLTFVNIFLFPYVLMFGNISLGREDLVKLSVSDIFTTSFHGVLKLFQCVYTLNAYYLTLSFLRNTFDLKNLYVYILFDLTST